MIGDKVRASFTSLFDGQKIVIADMHSESNPTMSVTNDAEAVVEYLVKQYGDHQIICKDTDGQWDELKHNNGIFTGFAPAQPPIFFED